MLFLPDRAQAARIPRGWTQLNAGGQRLEGNFVKVALNVVPKVGSPDNVLPELLRGWFGPDAGSPGTKHRVRFARDAGGGWTMAPVGPAQEPASGVRARGV